MVHRKFQSALPRGERLSNKLPYCTVKKFQSALPRGERHQEHATAAGHRDFNPRSHEGSDTIVRMDVVDKVVFQSALPRGERLSVNAHSAAATYFNPRSHEGSDLNRHFPCTFFAISIRAPTRGATVNSCRYAKEIMKFQSALPRGERPSWFCTSTAYLSISIRAPTRGATLPAFLLPTDVHYFNPRSHEGSDLNRHFPCTFFAISIRAPTRGATWKALRSTRCLDIFQSALPRGERRQEADVRFASNQISIRAPTRGATKVR